jgi:hypothetical protein
MANHMISLITSSTTDPSTLMRKPSRQRRSTITIDAYTILHSCQPITTIKPSVLDLNLVSFKVFVAGTTIPIYSWPVCLVQQQTPVR